MLNYDICFFKGDLPQSFNDDDLFQKSNQSIDSQSAASVNIIKHWEFPNVVPGY
jgi:hypothetical protein